MKFHRDLAQALRTVSFKKRVDECLMLGDRLADILSGKKYCCQKQIL